MVLQNGVRSTRINEENMKKKTKQEKKRRDLTKEIGAKSVTKKNWRLWYGDEWSHEEKYHCIL